MTNLYEHKLKKMNDEVLLEECAVHGKRMERGQTRPDDLERARMAFTTALDRPSLQEHYELFKTALRVLRIL